MEFTLLGTSAMVPTKDRNHTAAFLSYKTEGILFDCGEGTQRQFKLAGLSLTKVTKILITHWHGDHTLGLPGLIHSLSALDYTKTLRIYGPKGTKKAMKHVFEIYPMHRPINVEINEVEDGVVFQNKHFKIECAPMQHGTPCVAYSFIEKDRKRILMSKLEKKGVREGPWIAKLQAGKDMTYKGKKYKAEDYTQDVRGKKISFVTDTRFNLNAVKLAKDSDLLVCEASYTEQFKDKAQEYNHLTARQAGQIAAQSESKKLVLIHFSARYKSPGELEEDARVTFDNVFAGKDLMKIKL